MICKLIKDLASCTSNKTSEHKTLNKDIVKYFHKFMASRLNFCCLNFTI